MLEAGDRACCDGGLVARPAAGPRGRDPLRGGGVHEPDPGPPGLPRRHGGLLRGEAAPVPAREGPAPRPRRRQPRRRLRAPAGGRDRAGLRRRPGHVLGRGRRRGDDPGRGGRVRRLRLAVRAVRGARRVRGRDAAARPLQRRERARRAGGRGRAGRLAGRGGRRRSPAPSAFPAGSSRSPRGSRSPSWWTTPTRRTRSRTCSGRAPADEWPRDLRVRLRRRPRPREAPADGRDRRAAGRRAGGHLGQPALRGPGGDRARDPGGDRGRPDGLVVEVDRRAAIRGRGRARRRRATRS